MQIQAKRLRIQSVLIASLAALLLGACSTDYKPELVKTTPVTFYDSFSQMEFKDLPGEEELRVGIHYEDPAFRFEGGLSRYEALRLPALPQPYLLRVESEVVRDSSVDVGTLFYPVLTFLDGNMAPIRTFDSLPYVMQKETGRANYIVSLVQISDELAAARYVVIHTQDDKLDKAIGRDQGKDLMQSKNFDTMMFAPITAPLYRYEFAPDGWLRLKAEALETPKPPLDAGEMNSRDLNSRS